MPPFKYYHTEIRPPPLHSIDAHGEDVNSWKEVGFPKVCFEYMYNFLGMPLVEKTTEINHLITSIIE